MELGVEIGDLLKAFLIYALVSTFVFIQPPEFRSSGFTLENILHKWLGDKQNNFLDHQLRRITLTMLTHILFFPGFFLVLAIISDDIVFNYWAWPSTIIQAICSSTILLASLGFSVVGFLCTNNFQSHYAVKKFRQFDTDWQRLSQRISREMQDPFAVKAVDSGESGVYVLDSWVVHFGLYNINVAKLDDTRFIATQVIEHPLSNQNQDFQIVIIRVESCSLSFLPFTFNLQSRNILQLIQDKVGSAFTISDEINLPLSKIDEFIPVFRACIAENEPYEYEGTQELDNCFGCSAVAPNVKIAKRCDSQECSQCNCRPTWCHSCLGRIFAHEQDPELSHSWLQGTARCPTCRARFCCVDVQPMILI